MNTQSVTALREMAKSLGIKGYSKLKKEELIDLINKAQNTNLSTTEDVVEDTFDIEEEVSNEPTRELKFTSDTGDCEGVLEVMPEGYGFLRSENYLPGSDDVYVGVNHIKKFGLKTGDMITGKTRTPREGEKFSALIYINKVNGDPISVVLSRVPFEKLTPIYPNQRLNLETPGKQNDNSVRLTSLIAPIGKGQRGMIVAPPKAGKTTFLKNLANSITENNKDVKLIVLLIDERPEEVTDMKRSVNGEVIYSTFDELPEHHTRVAEMVLERAQRLCEHKKDVVIILDSITRLARAYNLTIPTSGRTLSGGLDPMALNKPKRFFGSARNIEEGGSITIIASALVDTGSRMDDVIYEEFKGTGNMEVHLSRDLASRRIFPAIDIIGSSTRKEELLLSEKEAKGAYSIRRMIENGYQIDNMEQLLSMLDKTKNNEEFLNRLESWLKIMKKGNK